MRTSGRYSSFFKQASNYDSKWGNFFGARHRISENENDETPSDQPPQSHKNPRESHENPRDIHSIPFHDEDLEPLKKISIPYDFKIKQYEEHL